jgi:hypothetical protein
MQLIFQKLMLKLIEDLKIKKIQEENERAFGMD